MKDINTIDPNKSIDYMVENAEIYYKIQNYRKMKLIKL